MEDKQTIKTPCWIWGFIVLCALQPLLVYSLQHYVHPEGMVPTGLSIPDSAIFLHSMDAWPEMDSAYDNSIQRFGNDIFKSMGGHNFYAVPHLWLYITLGIFTGGIHMLAYELLNCIGVLFLLMVVYRLLGVIAPQHRNPAFMLLQFEWWVGGCTFYSGAIGGVV